MKHFSFATLMLLGLTAAAGAQGMDAPKGQDVFFFGKSGPVLLRVNIEITPFQKRPHLEIQLKDADDDEIASTSIIEPMSWKIEFTMHVRGELNNPYTLEARLFYPEGPAAELQSFSFDIKPPS